MTEEIIIDGVNVAGCEYFAKQNEHSCLEENGNCKNISDCNYKQLKRLEQENKNFEILAKSLYKRIEELEKENEALAFRERLLKEENTLLKEQLLKKSETEQSLQSALEENKELKTVYVSKSVIEKLDKADKYQSALEEINLILDELKQQYDYMADYSEIKEIQEKINEVLS